MSASDALAAIQVIHTVVSKVKDNKDELKSLSKRLQFIVQSLEESRQRDVIRDVEYEDSLSAVFETWNAGEITSDLRRLNEDAQTFLGVHTIKTLDLIQTAQSQQQAYLVSSVEEIIAKIAEIDLALSKSRSAPKIAITAPAPAIGMMMYAPFPPGAVPGVTVDSTQRRERDSYQFPAGSARRFEGASTIQGTDLLGTRISPSSVKASSSARPSTVDETLDIGGGPKVLVDSLRSSNHFTVTISGLQKFDQRYGPRSLDATFRIPGGATVDQILSIIQQNGKESPHLHLIEDDTMFIKVADGNSVFDAVAPGGLQISKYEPLMWWMNRYDEYHGITSPTPMKTEVEWTRKSLKVDNLTIRCHRTLRVPENGEDSQLPPDMGAFPIFPVAHLGPRVPEEMKRHGGFIMPMFRREALWVSLECWDRYPAVKLSVGGEHTSWKYKLVVFVPINTASGVNVVSGRSSSDTSRLRNGPQDYVVAGKQPWIDGIVTGAGIVRQFVVTEMHKGYTVEEQITGEAKVGGLQFDVYPRRQKPSGYFCDSGRRLHTILATPAELQLEYQTIAYIRFSSNVVSRDVESTEIKSTAAVPWSLSRYARRLSASPRLRALYPTPRLNCWTSPTGMPRFGGMGMSDSSFMPLGGRVDSPSLGVAAGGRIKQNIYRDKDPVRVYNELLGRRVHVHIVTPEFWEDLTGVLPPITPITRGLYKSQGIPWFKLFDDYVDSISETSQALASVLSVSELDKHHSRHDVKAIDPVVNPDAPPRCFQHALATSSCVLRPCGHAVCSLCLGQALLCGSKCSCGSAISKFVGMQQPLPQVKIDASENSADDDGMRHWNVQEIEQLSAHAVQHGKVVVIHRPEDNVAPLQQRDPISPTRPYSSWDPDH
ncbi:hypothetical protein NMY22_g7417 [Coprinellus aureogranulatus]|nr:hypothetical protein NMY22_g7417 [Coprinellus aureogranulatus]